MQISEYSKNCMDGFVKIFKEIVERESPSQNKELCDKLADYLEELFSEFAEVTRIKQEKVGDNLRIEFGKACEEGKQILILCHLDTVWDKGTIDGWSFKQSNNKITGPGVYDMKFGIVQAYFTFKGLIETNTKLKNKVVLYINSDEEIGSLHSTEFIVKEAKKSSCVLLLEPSEESGFAKTQRKGMFNYKIEVHGKSAHAGAFHKDGVSAIKELSAKILQIEALTNYEMGTTANVGVLRGGNKVNVISEYAEAECEVRFDKMEEANRVENFMNSLSPENKGAILKIIQTEKKMPFVKTEGNIRLYEVFKKTTQKLGQPSGEIFVGGLSDGNTTSCLGIPTIDGLGAIGSHAHSRDEYISVDKICDRVELLMEMLIELENF